MTTSAYRSLYSLAEDQMGYVTTAQAATVGVHPMTLVMMARRGAVERVSRGVYRLVDFPVHPLSQYRQATLWPYERLGVLSYVTALSLWELSDADPAKVHITIPTDFRVQRKIPDYLVVHRAELPPDDVTGLEGMPITTPARTIRDCHGAHLGNALITQAIGEARRNGMLSAAAVSDLERELRLSPSGNPENVSSAKDAAVRLRIAERPRDPGWHR